MDRFRQFLWLVQYGSWSCGWASRKKWPEKSWLGVGMDYYDGPLFHFHLGPAYIVADHFPTPKGPK